MPTPGLVLLFLVLCLGLGSAFVVHPSKVTTNVPSTTELSLFRQLQQPKKQIVNGHAANGSVNGANGRTKNGRRVNGGSSAVDLDNIPYVIEELGDRPSDIVFHEIAEMCIDVFFNNGNRRSSTPWKEAQLAYLRTIQTADLRRRRSRDGRRNAMYVSYKVEEASPTAAKAKPLILDLNDVYNLSPDSARNCDFVRGELLGFCEVSMIPFGLGDPSQYKSPFGDGTFYDDENDNSNGGPRFPMRRQQRGSVRERPVLTNLSVKKEARKSGVGSKLLEACETKAARVWGQSEIVLEVEDDNDSGQNFYRKRGYSVLFSDPTSRRYNVDGFVLRKVRCTRQILRKSLNSRQSQIPSDAKFDGFDVLRRLRENMFQLSG